jgi:HEPN domain-containing protein
MNERDARNELVRAWLERARRDLGAARQLAAAPDAYLDVAVYHAQQAAEKALKGLLAYHDHELEKTHDLKKLLRLAEAYAPTVRAQRSAATLLTPYASKFRYVEGPLEPSRAECDAALAAASDICEFILALLPPDVQP